MTYSVCLIITGIKKIFLTFLLMLKSFKIINSVKPLNIMNENSMKMKCINIATAQHLLLLFPSISVGGFVSKRFFNIFVAYC